jgi:hypothetical protein
LARVNVLQAVAINRTFDRSQVRPRNCLGSPVVPEEKRMLIGSIGVAT